MTSLGGGTVTSGDQDDLAPRVALLEFREGVLNSVERVGGGNRNLKLALVDQRRQMAQVFPGRAVTAACRLGANSSSPLEGDDRFDSVRSHAELHREVDVLGSVEVDERIDPIGRRRFDALGQTVAIGDLLDPVRLQPIAVGVRRDPEHPTACEPQQLHDEDADATGRA